MECIELFSANDSFVSFRYLFIALRCSLILSVNSAILIKLIAVTDHAQHIASLYDKQSLALMQIIGAYGDPCLLIWNMIVIKYMLIIIHGI